MTITNSHLVSSFFLLQEPCGSLGDQGAKRDATPPNLLLVALGWIGEMAVFEHRAHVARGLLREGIVAEQSEGVGVIDAELQEKSV